MKYIADDIEMSKIDKYTIDEIKVPQLVLMERAAYEVALFVMKKFNKEKNILVVVEGGNNGGDGVAVARILKLHDYNVSVYNINGINKKTEAFRKQCEIAENMEVNFVNQIVDGYDVIIDGIFGVGLSRDVSGEQAEVIELLNSIKACKIAIDIPSGIDAACGRVLGIAFKADYTVTFGLMKLGMLLEEGKEYAGSVILADIGFPPKAIKAVDPKYYSYEINDIDRLLPNRKPDGHKGTFGKVGVIAGSDNMAGAALFSTEAAYRMGCGLVKLCTTKSNTLIAQTNIPEALLVTYDSYDAKSVDKAIEDMLKWSDVLVVGPGLSKSKSSQKIVERVLKEYDKTIILDADGINILADNPKWLKCVSAKLIITPHLMEMSRLADIKISEIKNDKYNIARNFANKNNTIVCLKDARTIVSDGNDGIYINVSGCDGMATGGSGDVLTGIIASLAAQGMDAYEATKLGVYIHGLAGQSAAENEGSYTMIARDIIKGITKVIEGEYNVQ